MWHTTFTAALFVGLVLGAAAPAMGQGWQPDQPRTVQWYAGHPAERDRTRRACLNDPGHLEATPDCINAKRGDLEAAAQQSGSPHPGGFLGAMTPQYWAEHQNERALQLAYCRRMTTAHQADGGCAQVFQSLELSPAPRQSHTP